jgi:curved DNA-binding protein CbpA
MTSADPLTAWRGNPFFVLGVSPTAARTEVERAGQKLLALLALGSMTATHYDTPFGVATRDADAVRAALAALRDPQQRVIHELLAEVAPPNRGERSGSSAAAWPAAARAIGWVAKWPA